MISRDIYTTEMHLTDSYPTMTKVEVKQVAYWDGSIFQGFDLTWNNGLEVRKLVKELEADEKFMDNLSTVQPFSIYNFTGNSLYITFKEGFRFDSVTAKATAEKIINIIKNKS